MTGAGWRMVPFREAVEDVTSGNRRTRQRDYLRSGHLPIVDQGQKLVAGYTNDEYAVARVDLPAIVFGDHTRCLKFIDFPFAVGADGVKVLRPVEGIDPRYLFHFLRTVEVHDHGYARHFKYLKEHYVPVPSIDEQRKVTTVLDAAERARSSRSTAIGRLDLLAQAIYVDMFGDPVSNPHSWERVPLAEVLDRIDSGQSPVCLDRTADGHEWGVLKAGAVTYCTYDEAQHKTLPEDIVGDPKHEVREGDLLFSRKNTRDLVGACAYVRATRPRLLLSDLIFRLVLSPNSHLDPAFVHQQMIHPRQRAVVQQLAGGSSGSMPNISKERLRSVEICRPPASLQLAYRARLDAIDKTRSDMQQSARALDNLFASLQQRAFAGEL